MKFVDLSNFYSQYQNLTKPNSNNILVNNI
jgi:hypothetical protein